MKKGLIIGGIALAGFGFYRYFRYQLDMALNYDYKIKRFKIINGEALNELKNSYLLQCLNGAK